MINSNIGNTFLAYLIQLNELFNYKNNIFLVTGIHPVLTGITPNIRLTRSRIHVELAFPAYSGLGII